jgi:hypothetical protein
VTSRKTAAKAKKVSSPAIRATARSLARGTPAPDVGSLFDRIVSILEEARARVVRSVNSEMVLAYWQIGRELVQSFQEGTARAEYGKLLIEELSRRLAEGVGRGFSTTNLRYFRTFYLGYKDRRPEIRHIGSGELAASSGTKQHDTQRRIRHTAGGVLMDIERAVDLNTSLDGFSPVLGWSHYRLLMNVDHEGARRFYEIEAEHEEWSVPHLERQIHTQLFARLLKSRDKAGVMDLASRGQALERPIDAIKHPYVLDFLDLPESPRRRGDGPRARRARITRGGADHDEAQERIAHGDPSGDGTLNCARDVGAR